MMCRKKPSKKRRKLRRYIALFIALAVAVTAYYELMIKAVLRDIIIREMKTISEQAVNSAVEEFLGEHFDVGEKLSDISYSGKNVSAITSNPSYINFVKTEITRRAQDNIDELCREQGISANAGSFTGLIFMMNVGPEIHFPVDCAKTVSCEFESSLESAGINQTIHHVVMTVNVELLVYNPFRIKETVTASSTYEIAQTVIVGSVPYYGGIAGSWN